MQQRLAELEVGFEEGLATAALFFGGRPVAGQRGVESGFAGHAVAKFQDLVAKLMVQAMGELGQRGPVPNRAASTMHITSIVRGSFGFLMEELQPQGQFIDTALSKAVDEASRLMIAFSSENEADFQSAVGEVDTRVLTTAGEFFSLLGENQATLRLVTTHHDGAFNTGAVQLAMQRAQITIVDEINAETPGQLNGALPEGHMFEFTSAGGGVIRGRVARQITSDQLMQWNLTLLNADVTARFKVRRVHKEGNLVSESYTLLGIDAGQAQIEQQL